MTFDYTGRAKLPPLTAFCTRLSEPANLLGLADSMIASRSSNVDNRAVVLSLVIMAGAGNFVGGLRWDPQETGMWDGSRHYLRNTNLDVIAAEAIIWIYFLMGRFYQAEESSQMSGRIGYGTTFTAAQLTLKMIEKQTGFDFKASGVERRKLYLEAAKDGGVSFEPFATILLRSIGRRSLAEPLKTVGPLPPPEWTPLSLNAGVFFSTIPLAIYETFKNFLREWPDRFPQDEELDE